MCEHMKINGIQKLIPNLYDKKRYIIHIRALDQALKHGLVLECIHRAIEFKQSAWMKEYIDFNTKLRTAAKDDFEKDFYKLMNNSVFGKTMENIRKRRNIKLVTNREAYLEAVLKPSFKSGVLFAENLMGCEMGKMKVVMNKPIYLGQAILDLSKIVMYEFHYDYMKLKYPEGLTLCYMNKDSLIYYIETDGNINYTSVKFEYNGGKIPPLRVDGKFKLFKFKNSKGDIYSLSTKCNEKNERFFERLCEAVLKGSCRLVLNVNGRKLKPEEFELVKDSKVAIGRNIYAKIYTRKSGKLNVAYPLNLLKIQFQYMNW